MGVKTRILRDNETIVEGKIVDKSNLLPVPCALCRKPPVSETAAEFIGDDSPFYKCPTVGCFSHRICWRTLGEWMAGNEELTSKLREAFEAGRARYYDDGVFAYTCENFESFLANRK